MGVSANQSTTWFGKGEVGVVPRVAAFKMRIDGQATPVVEFGGELGSGLFGQRSQTVSGEVRQCAFVVAGHFKGIPLWSRIAFIETKRFGMQQFEARGGHWHGK